MPNAARLSVLGRVFVAAAAALASATALADKGSRVEVTITNLTRGQIISPVVVASHNAGFEPLFRLGSPASSELAYVAEDAILDPLIAALDDDPDVYDVETVFDFDMDGMPVPILPGKSASVVVEVRGGFHLLSMAGMLVTTNDAFFALRGVRVPNHRTSIHYSPAYDAGSEANNEDCDYIPGPPCGNGGVRDTAGAEGYVHIHAGIHGVPDLDGVRDLDPSMHDWRNPVAEISVTRLSDE